MFGLFARPVFNYSILYRPWSQEGRDSPGCDNSSMAERDTDKSAISKVFFVVMLRTLSCWSHRASYPLVECRHWLRRQSPLHHRCSPASPHRNTHIQLLLLSFPGHLARYKYR